MYLGVKIHVITYMCGENGTSGRVGDLNVLRWCDFGKDKDITPPRICFRGGLLYSLFL